MCLSEADLVQRLYVNSVTRFAVVFTSYHHPGTPRNRFIHVHPLQDAHVYITLEVASDLFIPVDRDNRQGIDGSGDGVGLQGEFKRRTMHQR